MENTKLENLQDAKTDGVNMPTVAENENNQTTAAEIEPKNEVEPTIPVVEQNATVEPTINNTDTLKVDEVKPTKKLQPKIKPTRNRFSLTGNFNADEMATIRKVIDERKKENMTTTDDHFVRQCVDFALCHHNQLQMYLTNLPQNCTGLFGIPNDVTIVPLTKKGFFYK